jgi:hypothetical protein
LLQKLMSQGFKIGAIFSALAFAFVAHGGQRWVA